MKDEKREFFRLVYPLSEKQFVSLSGARFQVLDMSEEGVRVVVADEQIDLLGQEGDPISGNIQFSDQSVHEVKGTILRRCPGECVVQLSKGVPFPTMMAEQRRLIQKYRKT